MSSDSNHEYLKIYVTLQRLILWPWCSIYEILEQAYSCNVNSFTMLTRFCLIPLPYINISNFNLCQNKFTRKMENPVHLCNMKLYMQNLKVEDSHQFICALWSCTCKTWRWRTPIYIVEGLWSCACKLPYILWRWQSANLREERGSRPSRAGHGGRERQRSYREWMSRRRNSLAKTARRWSARLKRRWWILIHGRNNREDSCSDVIWRWRRTTTAGTTTAPWKLIHWRNHIQGETALRYTSHGCVSTPNANMLLALTATHRAEAAARRS